MEATFTKEIEVIAPVFNDQTDQHEYLPVTKTATFKEFSRTDKDQHKLHFMLMTLYEASDSKIKADSDQLYDIAVRAINILLLPDPNFTIQDKEAFLNDSVALLSFATWLLKEKITPFFLQLMKK